MCHGAAAQLCDRTQIYHRAQLYNCMYLVAIDRMIQTHEITLFRYQFKAVVVILSMQTVLHLILQ